MDCRRVRAVPAQHRRRVKGTLAGADGEALGIKHDAGHQRLGLAAEHIRRFGKLLDDLGHKLAGRRRVGLDKAECGVVYIGRGDAVMVYDRDALAKVQQIRALHLLRAVRVHNGEERVRVDLGGRFLRGEEYVLILRLAAHHIYKRGRGAVLRVRDYRGVHAELPRKAAYADRRADAVEIAEAVTHDKHLRGVLYKLGKSVCHKRGT